MTNDKALEAAFRKSADDFRPDPELFVCMDPTGCYHVSWNEAAHREKMATVGAEHEARYFRSALPGEAEVVAWAYPQGEKLGVTTNRQTACDAFPGIAKPTPLVTLASLQAMQARAEAAERELERLTNEREAWMARAQALREEINSNAHLQAAEDRVKEMEEALREAEELIGLSEHPAFPDPAYHEEVKTLGRRIGFGALMSTASAGWREVIEEKGMPNGSEFVAGPCFGSVQRTLGIVRTALKGGSNG